jgi:predicted esterase
MPAEHLTRRSFTGLLLAGAVGSRIVLPEVHVAPGARLTFRPKSGSAVAAPPGPQPLGLGADRDGVLYVPRGYQAENPVPLVLTLHGATGSSRGPVRNFGSVADDLGIALLVPDSRLRTWDAIAVGEFSVDRDFIDRALTMVSARIAVDPKRVGVAGFSDGATYSLALGRANGDIFRGITAFSPGFLIDVAPVGHAPVFISHGRQDSILPIEDCSRRIVPALREQGYKVTYQEFDGDHTVPPDMAVLGLKAAAGLT